MRRKRKFVLLASLIVMLPLVVGGSLHLLIHANDFRPQLFDMGKGMTRAEVYAIAGKPNGVNMATPDGFTI